MTTLCACVPEPADRPVTIICLQMGGAPPASVKACVLAWRTSTSAICVSERMNLPFFRNGWACAPPPPLVSLTGLCDHPIVVHLQVEGPARPNPLASLKRHMLASRSSMWALCLPDKTDRQSSCVCTSRGGCRPPTNPLLCCMLAFIILWQGKGAQRPRLIKAAPACLRDSALPEAGSFQS